ncbi:hypothetical protein JCM9279_006729 [Rhodotorula babjevae]
MGRDLDRFAVPIPDYLHCPVCLGAAYPPIVSCSSDHIVCRACVGEMRQSDRPAQCPTCREVMPVQLKVSLGFKRAIERYGYTCEREGCDWVGSVNDLEQHLENSCEYRKIDCDLCKYRILAKDRVSHDQECPELFIVCPRGGKECSGVQASGGPGMFRRRQLPQHDKVCAMFKCRVGCHTYTLLANRDAHESECAWQRSRISHLEQKLVRAEEQLVQAGLALELQRAAAEAAARARAQAQAGAAAEGREKRGEVEPVGGQQSPTKRHRGARTPEVIELDSENENGAGEGLRASVKGRAATGGGGGAGKKPAASGSGARGAGVLTQQSQASCNRGPGSRMRFK